MGLFERRSEQIVDGVGLQWAARGIRVVVVHDSFETVISDKIAAFRLVVRRDMNAHVQERESIRGAFSRLIPFSNVGYRRTDGSLAGGSGRIEKFAEDDVTGQITQVHGRARGKDASCDVRERQTRIQREVVGYNLRRMIKLGRK